MDISDEEPSDDREKEEARKRQLREKFIQDAITLLNTDLIKCIDKDVQRVIKKKFLKGIFRHHFFFEASIKS